LFVVRSRSLIARPLAGAGAVALASAGFVTPLPPAVPANAAQAADPGDLTAPDGLVVPDTYAGPTVPARTDRPTVMSEHRRLIVFGDSVANRKHCQCESFLSRYAKLVSDRADVHVDNLAGDGQTTAAVLAVLAAPATQDLVRKADTVVIVAGANDYRRAFEQVGHGHWGAAAYRAVARRVQGNLIAAIHAVTRLNPHTRVLTLGYWNAFKDGAVARTAYTARQRKAAAAATTSANDAIRAAAHVTATDFLSTRRAFAAAGAITPLLAADGDHPSPAGNTVLAQTLADAIWVK
jgi:lysophospholipase L1-like esterase